MIKVVFTYRTKTANLDELLAKFIASGAAEFNSEPSNVGIDRMMREDGDDTVVVLTIAYNSMSDYEARTDFERSQENWNNIWFNENNKHIEESVVVYEVK